MLDCEESFLQERLLKRENETGRIDDNATAVAARLQFFKDNTLPVAHSYDEAGKLAVVSFFQIQFEVAVLHNLSQIFNFEGELLK